MSSDPPPPPYLAPYLKAAARHGGDFQSLLWANPSTQAARFDAILRAHDVCGKLLLDVGCGRADLLDFLCRRRARPAEYTGIEAVDALATEAERRAARARGMPTRILRADFIRDPVKLFVGAEVVVISGSLNTVDDAAFYETVRRAYDAAAEALVFNFLCSRNLAGAPHLHWRRTAEVLGFARGLCPGATSLADYLDGDCTVAMKKPLV